MKYQELMSEFAKLIGIDGEVSWDDDGVWRIGTEDIVFAFREIPELDSLLVYSSLGALPAANAEAFKTAILRANFMERGVPNGAFSLDEDDCVRIHRFFDLKRLDAKTLADGFEDFVTLVLDWRRLKEASAGVDEARKPETKLETAFDSYFNPDEFIKV